MLGFNAFEDLGAMTFDANVKAGASVAYADVVARSGAPELIHERQVGLKSNKPPRHVRF
jgi:hypothetical protein